MTCWATPRPQQTLEERQAEVTRALRGLEAAIQQNAVKVVIGANGAVTLAGWSAAARSDLTDVCAIRSLTAEGSWILRQALAREEARTGRKVNMNAVAAGVHSHDGGNTWHSRH